jgi:hypothetical protein
LATVVAVAASTQAGVGGAEASVTAAGSAEPGHVAASWQSNAGPHRLGWSHRMRPRPPRGVKAQVITGPLLNHGGPVMSAPRVYVDFWDWTSDPSGEQAYLENFFADVGGTSWLNTVSQYGGGYTGNLLAGTWSDSSSIPANPSDGAIQWEAIQAADHFGVQLSPNAVIVVATPTGHSTPGFGPGGFCAYHGEADFIGPVVAYINLPYMTDAGSGCGHDSVNGANGALDGVSIAAGHELAETITDPQGNAWFDAGGNEIGDKCAWTNLADISTPGGLAFAVQPLWSNAANGCTLSTPVTSPYAPLTGGLLTSGQALVKVGGIGPSTPYTNEHSGVAQVVVATDPGHGPLVGVLTTGGDAYVKQGGLDAQWVHEYAGVKQLALASDTSHGPLIGVLTTGGTALVKEGGLSTLWTTEYTGVSQLALASDPLHGPLIGVLTTGGTALVKEGCLSCTWVNELGGVKQLALASDTNFGPLIGVLTTGGTAYVKEGNLHGTWVNELGGVSQIALASDPVHGPLIGVLTTGGTAYVKEGNLSGTWVNELGGVKQLALGSDIFDGPLISVLTTSGTDFTKHGNLSGTWVPEFLSVTQITDAG